MCQAWWLPTVIKPICCSVLPVHWHLWQNSRLVRLVVHRVHTYIHGIFFIMLSVSLTHWPLEDFNDILDEWFSCNLSHWWLMCHLWNCHQMIVTGSYWWYVNIGLGNGLVPSANKPLPEPMLTEIYVAIWRHQASTNYKYSQKILMCCIWFSAILDQVVLLLSHLIV